jgi:hypothetical protein
MVAFFDLMIPSSRAGQAFCSQRSTARVALWIVADSACNATVHNRALVLSMDFPVAFRNRIDLSGGAFAWQASAAASGNLLSNY